MIVRFQSLAFVFEPSTLTFVDELELADQLKSDVRLFILEKLQEQRKEVFDRSLLAQQRSESTDVSSKGSFNVRGLVAGKVSDTRKKSGKDGVRINELGETYTQRKQVHNASKSFLSLDSTNR